MMKALHSLWNLKAAGGTLSRALLSGLFLAATFLGPSAEAGTITVTSPNGGENWLAGTTHTITWTWSGADVGSYLKIELLQGNSVFQTITASTPKGASGRGSYTWRIFSYQPTARNYKIKITSTGRDRTTDSSDSTFAVTCHCQTPPFIDTNVKHNVLVILDNSNSMDEDFYGEALGSYAPTSKSVVAKKALSEFVTQAKQDLRIGLMTYKLGSSISTYHLHNSQYFASYDPRSWCPATSGTTPDYVQACVDYCRDGNTTRQSLCTSGCQALNAGFDSTYFDEIISHYARGSEQRNRYCGLVFPKTRSVVLVNDDNSTATIYYKGAYPYYASVEDPYHYCYSSFYNAAESVPPSYSGADYYTCYTRKTGTSDGPSGYSGSSSGRTFQPTDTDYALGFGDFGRRMTWYHIGRTWFRNDSPGGGYLHVPVSDLVDNLGADTATYTNLLTKLDAKEGDEAGYMFCTAADKNTCSYIVNAGLTPTSGTLQSALDYFKGTSSPIQQWCQKNFIIYVTDGLPSVNETGTAMSADALMPTVLAKLDSLRQTPYRIGNTTYTFDIKTFVLGVGLSSQAKQKLDEMAVHGGTAVNGHAYYADDPDQFLSALREIFSSIVQKVSAGTSVSILSEKAQRGANLMQAIFYATRPFGSTEVNWVGYFYNYWLYVSRTKFNMREDTVHDFILDLDSDLALSFNFNEQTGLRVFRSRDLDGDGEPDVSIDNVTLDGVSPVWEGGKLLFLDGYNPTTRRLDPTRLTRTLFTVGTDGTPVPFDDNATHKAAFQSLLGDPATFASCLRDGNDTRAVSNLVRYINGVDVTGCRNRTVTVQDNNGTATRDITSTWKLGDIVYSTPKIASDYQFCVAEDNQTFGSEVCDTDADCTPLGYPRCRKKESVVFTGANDGMLHAFKTGVLVETGLNKKQGQVAKLEGTDLGKEMWAFIPRNALPYLRLLADPNYCHLNFVDLSPYITRIGSKLVLIGGMRLGGGTCEASGGTYLCGAPSDTCGTVTCSDINTCYNPSNCTGLSSYFALDITNPERPQFLWEFTHPLLGYSYSGPAVIKRRIDSRDRYFVMFLSGPTTREGTSTQNLHAFVLTLNDQLKIEGCPTDTPGQKNCLHAVDFGSSLGNAFGGRLFTNGLDMDEDSYTDYIFFGYARAPSAQTWQGGIAKVWTGDANPLDATQEPQSWDFDVQGYFNAAQQPITTKVEFAKCFNRWYIYAGSGRYFYKDDQYLPQNDWIMGVPFLCDANNRCDQSSINFAHGNDRNFCTDLAGRTTADAWFHELNPEETYYYKERNITDTTVTTRNVVFFTTTQPIKDVCGIGGRTRIWGLNCATGEAVYDRSCGGYVVKGNLGNLFLQTSTGAIHRIDPFSSFSQAGGKTSDWFVGMPPENTPPYVAPYETREGEILHWIEK